MEIRTNVVRLSGGRLEEPPDSTRRIYNNVIDFEGNTVVCLNTDGEKTDSIENYSVNPNQISETVQI